MLGHASAPPPPAFGCLAWPPPCKVVLAQPPPPPPPLPPPLPALDAFAQPPPEAEVDVLLQPESAPVSQPPGAVAAAARGAGPRGSPRVIPAAPGFGLGSWPTMAAQPVRRGFGATAAIAPGPPAVSPLAPCSACPAACGGASGPGVGLLLRRPLLRRWFPPSALPPPSVAASTPFFPRRRLFFPPPGCGRPGIERCGSSFSGCFLPLLPALGGGPGVRPGM
mmetsp:Transcript_39863/g.124625  ORF Transcript_39863/g.124625 Transcript_39863/m.124625 type:complete len:222 (+) Transcript_39863:762-1427(+)